MEPYLLVLALLVAGLGASSLLGRRRHALDPQPDTGDLVVDVDPARWEPAEAIRIERSAEEQPWAGFDPFAGESFEREPVPAGVAAVAAGPPAVMVATAEASSSPSQPLPTGVGTPLNDLWQAVRSTPPDARGEALSRIENLPPPALLSVAVAHARDEEPADRILAVIFARLAGEAGVPTLLNALIDQAPRVRRAAALGLSGASPTIDVIRALSATARDDWDDGVRAQAMASLQQVTGAA